MNATSIFVAIGAAAFAFLVVSALATGKVGAGRGIASVTFERQKDPRDFWLYVLVYAAFGGWMVYLLIHPTE